MNTTLSKLRTYWDYLTDRYACELVSGADAEQAFAIRQDVFGEELKRAQRGELSVGAQDDFDAHSLQLLCRDTKNGKAIGCLRVTGMSFFNGHPEYEKEYHLHAFPAELQPQVVVATRLAVLREYRQSPAALLLAVKSFEVALTRLGSLLSVIVCEPNLFPMYRRLGYRPLDRIFLSPWGGYRLPLFLVLHDLTHLKACHSPFLPVTKRHVTTIPPQGLAWLADLKTKKPLIDPCFTLIGENETTHYGSILTEGLSHDGLTQLLKNAVTVSCEVGDAIIAQGDGGRNVGFVQSGLLEVRVKGETVALLGPGEVFGEIAFILGTPRSADVIAAAPNTEVVLISLSAVNRLQATSDRTQIWRNLAALLARRVITKNTLDKS